MSWGPFARVEHERLLTLVYELPLRMAQGPPETLVYQNRTFIAEIFLSGTETLDSLTAQLASMVVESCKIQLHSMD